MSILATPFLTDIDPQAAIKGSRDPLGLQTIWARLGRHVVGNLTTVTHLFEISPHWSSDTTLQNASPVRSAVTATSQCFSAGNS
jgi:hypothetical protein